MTADELVNWLRSHSESVHETETEMVFTHFTGETSLLVLSPSQKSYLPVNNPFLSSFYRSFCGASIGNGHIVIMSNIQGGVDVSHGYSILDLSEAKSKVEEWGMVCDADEDVFMQVAGWMFVYSIKSGVNINTALKKYDRDYQKSRTVGGVREVLEEWWKIVLEDRAVYGNKSEDQINTEGNQ